MGNSATLVIPGSHLWDSDRVPKIEEAGYAMMQVGDCFCMVGELYHAGGHNSTKVQKRSMHDLRFCRGYLRQEVYSRLLLLFG